MLLAVLECALHMAAMAGTLDCVRSLIRHGAQLDTPVLRPTLHLQTQSLWLCGGSHALTIAAFHGRTDIAVALLEAQVRALSV